MEWFEVVGSRYADTLEPEQFMYSLLTRSQRISHENLRLRDKAWLEGYERWFAARAGINIEPDGPSIPPMFTPYSVRGLRLENRIVMSPDGHVFGRRGHAQRLSPRSLRQPRAWRRRAHFYRDDVCLAGCTDHARLSRDVERRATGGLETRRRIRPRPRVRQSSACSWAIPAAKARRAWPGKASISRCLTATGRSSRPRPCRTRPTIRCRAR